MLKWEADRGEIDSLKNEGMKKPRIQEEMKSMALSPSYVIQLPWPATKSKTIPHPRNKTHFTSRPEVPERA